jgi:hypothetical protein
MFPNLGYISRRQAVKNHEREERLHPQTDGKAFRSQFILFRGTRAKKAFLTLVGTASFPEAKEVLQWARLVWGRRLQ